MSVRATLSASEFASLKVIGAGFDHSAVTEPDAARLLELGLIYRLLGSLRMTHAGRARIISGS
jgi:hypothetical protein